MNNTMRISLIYLAMSVALAAHADPAGLARNCAHCHGLTGISSAELIPHIGGQRESYLKTVLAEFKQGKRSTLFMSRLAKGYTDQELEAVAIHFARMPWSPGMQKTDPALLERGGTLAKQRCVACHGGDGLPASETAPRIAGQWAPYLKAELVKFMSPPTRMTDPGMQNALVGLADTDIEALAQFYASQR